VLTKALIGLVRLYQVALSPWLPPSCRYEPSCSTYMLDALRVHGAGRGLWLGLRRLARCAPWGGHGFDPVPPAGRSQHEASADEVSRAPCPEHVTIG
jgi:putative membrane protein insertion efficiency factor